MNSKRFRWMRWLARNPFKASTKVAGGWFGLCFISAVFFYAGMFTWVSHILGSLYYLNMQLYEEIVFFDKKREILPGIGVFVRGERMLLFIACHSLVVFLACWYLGRKTRQRGRSAFLDLA